MEDLRQLRDTAVNIYARLGPRDLLFGQGASASDRCLAYSSGSVACLVVMTHCGTDACNGRRIVDLQAF